VKPADNGSNILKKLGEPVANTLGYRMLRMDIIGFGEVLGDRGRFLYIARRVRVLVHARGAGMWASAHLAAGKAILDGLFVGFLAGFFLHVWSDVFFKFEQFLLLNIFWI
jgi:hypothetical protein